MSEETTVPTEETIETNNTKKVIALVAAGVLAAVAAYAFTRKVTVAPESSEETAPEA